MRLISGKYFSMFSSIFKPNPTFTAFSASKFKIIFQNSDVFEVFQVFQKTKVKKYKRTQSRCIFPSKTPPKIFQTGFRPKFSTALHGVSYISHEMLS